LLHGPAFACHEWADRPLWLGVLHGGQGARHNPLFETNLRPSDYIMRRFYY
jgi:hypothetical protein